MVRRRVKKGRVVGLCVVLFLLVITGCGMGFYFFNYIVIPSDLKSVNHGVEKLTSLDKDEAVVVYYDGSLANGKDKAINIMSELKSFESSSKKRTHRIADYVKTKLNDDYTQITYRYVVDGNELKRTSYIVDGNQNILDESIFGENIYRHLQNEVRRMMKESNASDDYFFSKDFALDTYYKNIKIGEFYFEDNNLYITDSKYHQTVEFDLNQYAGDINLDIGITANKNIIDRNNRYVDPNRPMIAFTFDDGPHNVHTNDIIEELTKYDGAATFFMLGWQTEKKGTDNTILNVINSGSEVANHSYSHKHLKKLDDTELEYQTYEFSRYVDKLTNNQYSIKLFRVPYGEFNDRVKNFIEYPLIQWNEDPEDWKVRNTSVVVQRVKDNLSDGDIFVMHDIYETTKNAVLELIPYAIEQGYQIVTVSELFEAKGKVLEPHNIYTNVKPVK